MRKLTNKEEIEAMMADYDLVSMAFQCVTTRFCDKSLDSLLEQIVDELTRLLTISEVTEADKWLETHKVHDLVDWIKGEIE